jgi:hypothetical protein
MFLTLESAKNRPFFDSSEEIIHNWILRVK